MYYYHSSLFYPFHLIFAVLCWILIIWLIIWLFRSVGGYRHWRDSGRHDHDKDSAMNILKERYAKGEINKEEFEEKKKGLLS
jgi:putative membrane protein